MRSRFTSLAGAAMTALLGLAGCGGAERPATAYPETPSGGYPAQAESPVEVAASGASARRVDFESDNLRGELQAEPQVHRTVSVASTGGASSPHKAPPAPPGPPQQPQASPPADAKKAPKPEPTQEPAQTRDLVIYTARFTMAVYQVDQGLTAVERIARDNGGYLGQKKDREITVRVPRGRFETTLAAVDQIGDVLHREIDAQDVTDEHVDLEIRIKNARAMQHRLTELLTKASVKDALEIEKELHRVTEELERLEGRMKVLKDRVAFSTITVTFAARGAQIQVARTRLPFPWLGALNLPSLLSLSEEK
ncbi:MAG: DUF4349 domain-containing protein [Labilithrix sp.]|nr:DUF4349 domain-containing protein [Labilithrix sp.]